MKKAIKNKEYWRDIPNFMDSEKFFDIPGYEGLYKISNYGKVKTFHYRINGRVLKPCIGGNGYIILCLFSYGTKKTTKIHKLMQLTFFNNIKSWIDHKDNNRVNNMLDNLRIATRSENLRNCKKRKGVSSKYLGVSYEKERCKWAANIFLNKKDKRLGRFDNEKEAAIAYDQAVKKYRPETAEFNKLNFPSTKVSS